MSIAFVFERILLAVKRLPAEIFQRSCDLAALLRKPRWSRIYFRLWLVSLFSSPYLSRAQLLKERQRRQPKIEGGENSGDPSADIGALVYGELPLFSAVRLFERAGITESSELLDIGCGRGMALLAARYLGASARGVELDPRQAYSARFIFRNVRSVTIELGDALDLPFGTPSHVFLNWCLFSDATMKALAAKLAQLPAACRFVAMGVPIADIRFVTEEKLCVYCEWGWDDAYLQKLVS